MKKTGSERHYMNGGWAAYDGHKVDYPHLSEEQLAKLRRQDRNLFVAVGCVFVAALVAISVLASMLHLPDGTAAAVWCGVG